jgi:hypothetical protein
MDAVEVNLLKREISAYRDSESGNFYREVGMKDNATRVLLQ